MEENKKWYESRTVWGGLVAVGAAAAGAALNVTVDTDTQEQIVGLVMSAVAIVGAAVSIYGRLKAEKKISK